MPSANSPRKPLLEGRQKILVSTSAYFSVRNYTFISRKDSKRRETCVSPKPRARNDTGHGRYPTRVASFPDQGNVPSRPQTLSRVGLTIVWSISFNERHRIHRGSTFATAGASVSMLLLSCSNFVSRFRSVSLMVLNSEDAYNC